MTNDEKKIDEMIIKEKRAYQNMWRHTHKQRVREYNEKYWRKKIEKILLENSQKENAI